MDHEDKRPICPRCGCRAIKVEHVARCTSFLLPDMTLGKVFYAGKRGGEATFVCEGDHKWNSNNTPVKEL